MLAEPARVFLPFVLRLLAESSNVCVHACTCVEYEGAYEDQRARGRVWVGSHVQELKLLGSAAT